MLENLENLGEPGEPGNLGGTWGQTGCSRQCHGTNLDDAMCTYRNAFLTGSISYSGAEPLNSFDVFHWGQAERELLM